MLTTAGSITLPGSRVVSWKAGDTLMVSQMNQNVGSAFNEGKDVQSPSTASARDFNQGWGGPKVSYIVYDNLSDTLNQQAQVSPRTDLGSFFWLDTVFGSISSRSGGYSAGGSAGKEM